MPAIKKKWMKTNMIEDSANMESFEDEDRELANPEDATAPVKKVLKRAAPPGPGMLKGLDGEVLMEKRKRFIPPAELKLSEWLDNNLEKRTEETISLPLLYKYYTELCQESESDILDVPEFNRMIKMKFGKSFGVQAASIYKSLIKEQKLGQKKKSSGVKMKDVVIGAINHFGNPWHGVRFFVLKQFIGTQYPALQIDTRPKILRRALAMGMDYGYIELTKGIGMAGSYRLPGAVEPPAKPKVSKAKKEGENEEGIESSSQKAENGEEEKSEDNKENEAAEETETGEKDSSPKPKKPKKVQTFSYSKISYSNPSKIEDTFPLAITYQSAPKAAGLPRIRRYIMEKYGETVTDNRWRNCLEHGVENGYWEHVSASGMSGRIHLLMDDFDPSSEKLEDRICAAVIACHDPKSASANQMKKYVSKYHPDFGVDIKPEKFKKALQRAIDMKMIRQISGIGASGSFLLVVPFTPTPAELAGEDDEDEDDEVDDVSYETQYIPKGTKSRGMPKVKTMEIISPKKSKSSSSSSSSSSRGGAVSKHNIKNKKLVAAAAKNKANKAGSKKDVAKSKSKGRSSSSGGSSKNTKKNRRRSPSPLTDEEEEEEEDEYDDELEYTPKKSQSRGGGSSRSVTPAKSSKKTGKKETPKSTPKAKPKSSPTKSGGGRNSAKKAASNTSIMLSSDDEHDSDGMVEYTPRKSTSRGGGGGGKAAKSQENGKRSPSKSSKKRKADSDSEDDYDDEPEYSPKKKVAASKSGSSKKKKARR